MIEDVERIWQDQCDAAESIRERFGLDNALNYVVGEKFQNFLDAAKSRPHFEAQIPAFAERLREMFEPHELAAFFSASRDQDLAPDVEDTEPDDLVRDAEKLMLVERAKELLLGGSDL